MALEPFLGGGALFFQLQPARALLSDINLDLINCYEQIRDNWSALEDTLRHYHDQHSKSFYYQIRAKSFSDPVLRAAKFIYLNRTCWNGLYRVNREGTFNVPIGTKKNVILPTDDFGSISRLLQGAYIHKSDFEENINVAGAGDFLYLDPPYTVKHNFNGFIKYNEKLFSWEDQERLKRAAVRAAERGASVVISNADHPSINELYADFPRKIPFSRKSVLASQNKYRNEVKELIILSW